MKKNSDSLTFKHRGLIGVVCLFPIGLAIIFSSPRIHEDTIIDFVMDAFGWFCFICYVTFRMWATLYIGGRKDKELQTQGPYSITRNPLYLGTFFFMLSIVFFFNSIFLLIAVLIIAAIYLQWIIVAEERILKEIFGDTFHVYVQKTPRLLPNFSSHRAPDSIEIRLKAVKIEAKRLLCSSLFPFLAEVLTHLRDSSWWPHWFILF